MRSPRTGFTRVLLRPRRGALVLALLAAPLLSAGAGEFAPLRWAWGLGRSDVATYDRRLAKDGGAPGHAWLHTVYGHDLRDRGSYLPVSPERDDLAPILGFRLPSEAMAEEKTTLDLPLRACVPIRAKGELVARRADDDHVEVTGTWAFASRGREERGHRWIYEKGKAETRAVVSLERRVVEGVVVEMSYRLVDLEAEGGTRPVDVRERHEIALTDVRRVGYEEFQPQVNAAIERGLAYLRTLREPDGAYRPFREWNVGSTALAAYTLAALDVPRTDPAIEEALVWLLRHRPERTYEAAVSLMAFERAYTPPGERPDGGPGGFVRDLPADRLAWCEERARWLASGSASPGTWGYPPDSPTSLLRFDGSNTQYAVLGLSAAVRLGFTVDERVWLGAIKTAELLREPKGEKGAVAIVPPGVGFRDEDDAASRLVDVPEVAGFRYATLDLYAAPWASMTAAAISTLAIARHELARLGSRKLPPIAEEVDAMILGGWAWLDRHWGMDRHPFHPRGEWYAYYLYSLERAAVLTRVKRLGGRDWYFEGAVRLVRMQKQDGSWMEEGGDSLTATCFALLFLKRATKPLVTGE
jgi:hypothetical protein